MEFSEVDTVVDCTVAVCESMEWMIEYEGETLSSERLEVTEVVGEGTGVVTTALCRVGAA